MADEAFTADFAILRNMARDLRGLARELGNRDAILQAWSVEPELGLLLSRAESDWAGHRRRLREFLEEAAATLERAVAGYQHAERNIVRAAAGGAGGAGT